MRASEVVMTRRVRANPGTGAKGESKRAPGKWIPVLFAAFCLSSACGGPTPQSQALTPGSAQGAPDETPESLAKAALAAPSPELIRALRARGQSGLDALLARVGKNPSASERSTIAKVAGQLDADVSRLFWHTDLSEAVLQAQRENKPILSLRMLGRLDEELSCANSRLFRTTLYPDARVSRLLRERFVLHWSSERKVPRITIDYGDGRSLVSTITGNSIHYIMDKRGRVVDALPGLYAAEDFARELASLEPVARAAGDDDDASWRVRVRGHHDLALVRTVQQLRTTLLAAGRDADAAAVLAAPSVVVRAPAGKPLPPPSARAAVPIAITKAAMEAPVLRRTAPRPVPNLEPLDGKLDRDGLWQELARARQNDIAFDASVLAVIRRKTPVTWTKSDGSVAPAKGPALARMLDVLKLHIAEDTLRNELVLRRRIHGWLTQEPQTFSALNRRVYSDLFLTPASDPWLGLLPQDVFSALPHGGVKEAR